MTKFLKPHCKFGRQILAVLILGCLLILIGCRKESISAEVHIPDSSFLGALIDLGVDKNSDGQISKTEAEATKSIHLWPTGIRDLSGIEYFINLDTLSVIMNPLNEVDLSSNVNLRYLELIGCGLSDLDLSENRELRYLDCSSSLAMKNSITQLDLKNNLKLESLSCVENNITNLDISVNILLHELHCGYNKIKEMDVRKNKRLTYLHCNNNLLDSLKVSENIAIIELITCGNNFTSFDISKNLNLVKIGIDNMPELKEVYVWTMPFPPAGISVLMGFSPNVEFSLKSDRVASGSCGPATL